MKRVDIAAVAMDADTGTPVVLLREQDAPHRLLPILIGPSDVAAIAYPASGQVPARPLTHDLLASVLEHLDAHVDAVEVTELRDGTFLAQLTVSTAAGAHLVDTRPSDAIALALRVDAPMLVSEAVLDEAGSLPPPGFDDDVIDQASIDDAVEEFRTFLDDLDPAQFALEEPAADDHAEDPTVDPDDTDGERD